jgi:glycerol-3-phosphate dehydrogenase
MERMPQALEGRFEVLVVGGGVTGVALARTLARSGVRTALVERGDFGAATSHNSAKIVHGGLRYVQHLDAVRIRESIRSQNAWLAAAPNLVVPMSFTMPTRGWGPRGPLALALGMIAYRALGGRRMAPVRAMGVGGRAEFLRRFPEVQDASASGYATWFDAQIRDSGRLITECVADAVAAGAVAVNHLEADHLLIANGKVEGVAVRDQLSGAEFEVKADTTITCLGPWTPHFFRKSGVEPREPGVTAWTRNANVVLKKALVQYGAIGVMSRQPGDAVVGKASRLFFVNPWQGGSIVGTTHDAYRGNPDDMGMTETEVSAFLEEVSHALAGEPIDLDEVASLHIGISPAEETGRHGAKRTVIQDEAQHGLRGCVAVTANKYTTAPDMAHKLTERVLDGKSGSGRRPADFQAPLPFAAGTGPTVDPASDEAARGNSERAWVEAIYGRRAAEVFDLAERHEESDEARRIFRARVEFGVRHEMAVRLGDALFRCTDLAERGRLGPPELEWAATWMARECGWSAQAKQDELALARRRLARHMCGGPGAAWKENVELVGLTEGRTNR